MTYRGDIRLEKTIDLKFTTRQFSTGTPFALVGGAVAAYPANGTTEITAGITLTANFDGRTGLNHVRVVATAANTYAAATDYDLVLTAGTVDGVNVAGETIGSFSIENRSAIMTTTADRTLNVLNGRADANIEMINDTLVTAAAGRMEVNVTHYGGSAGTFAGGRPEVNTSHVGGSAIIQTGGRPECIVASITAGAINAAAINAGAITAAKFAAGAIDAAAIADGAIDALTFAAGAINAAAIAADAITAAKIADGAIDAATFAAGAINAAAIATDAIDGDAIAASAVSEIQSGLATSAALATVQADTDDIQTRLPAALVSGRMDASVGAMAANVLTAAATAVDFATEINTGMATSAEIAVVLADTDNIQTRLPAALVSGRMDSSVGAAAADTITASALATDAGQEIADRIIARRINGGADGGRTIGQAFAAIRNKVEITGAGASRTLNAYDIDDLSVLWTGSVTLAARDAVVTVDPA